MTESFIEKLETRARAVDSLLCVGLDPRADSADAARDECLHLMAETRDNAAAFKVNSAFFEVFGADGIHALRQVIAGAPPEIPVILDAKRGDIADTSAAYARAAFETLGAGAITVSPYVGGDGLAPFLADAARGAFVLCKTSNPGADEFQALETSAGPVYEFIAKQAAAWNTRNNVGLVVGATDPARLARVRATAPGLWFLAPGIGAQGADLQAAVAAGLRSDGMGLLISSSRALAAAADPRAAAKNLRDQINAARRPSSAPHPPFFGLYPSPSVLQSLADDLLTSGCVRFGEFQLKSGQISPIYLDLRRLVSYPPILKRVARAYAELLRPLAFDRLAGIPYAALPIATATALEMNRPLIYPRREAKEYGTRAAIEGEFYAGETAVALDDLATTGDTKQETIAKLTNAGLVVRDIVVLIDRGQGAAARLAQAGYRLHAVATLPQLLGLWRDANAIRAEQVAAVESFLATK